MKKKLVYGVGINDADYVVSPIINGKQVGCTFYQTWVSMLRRCYSAECQAIQPTYKGCSVCSEWLTFSKFKSWMEAQDWKGKQLDKDLLVSGNRVYSPHTCVFVDGELNKFIIDHGTARGEWPLGVYFHKRAGKFKSQCRNPFSRRREYLGHFNCPEEAHRAWKKRKRELALELANLQVDVRVAFVLRNKYL